MCQQRLLQVARTVLWHREHHVDGCQLRDGAHAVGIAAAHHVAHVNRAQTDAAADGRGDAAVAQVQLGHALVGAVNHHGAFKLPDQRCLRVHFLAGNRVLAQKRVETAQRDAGAFKLGFIALALAGGLLHGQLEQAWVNRGHQLTGPHHLAFSEQHLLQHPGHLRPHLDGSLRRDSAQRVQRDGNVGTFGPRHTHRGATTEATRPARTTAWPARTGGTAAGRSAAGAGRAGGRTSGRGRRWGACAKRAGILGGMGEHPGQPACAGQYQQRDGSPYPARTAACPATRRYRVAGRRWADVVIVRIHGRSCAGLVGGAGLQSGARRFLVR